MRHCFLFAVAALIPAGALAQQPGGAYPPPQAVPQNGYPQQQQYPQNQYPQQQQYPQNQYPQAQQYPQNQYAQPGQQAQIQQPAPAAQRPTGRLALSTRSREVAGLVTDCANAVDNQHLDVARARCREAIAKEDTLAFAHYLLAEADTPDVANKELARAAELAKAGQTTRGEKLFIDGYRAILANRHDEARRVYDELVKLLNNDARALVARGRFRLETLGDAEGAAADFQKVIALDGKYPAAYGFLGGALADGGKYDDALAALNKYAELAPKEPNADAALARFALSRGALEEALTDAKKALAIDARFPPAQAVLGDVLQFSGKGKEARRTYASLIASDDAAVHHLGAMRDARSFLFDNRDGDAERALVAEADFATKTKRPGDQADALVELARMQLDRGAVPEAGQSLRQARQALEGPAATAATTERDRHRLASEGLHVRAMVLGAIGERQLAEARVDEMGAALKLAGDAHAGKQATALKGWIAARNGDDKVALGELAEAQRPTLRMALALAAARAGDEARAHQIMEELAKRTVNDLEGALTRSRAQAWVKAHPANNASAPAAPATTTQPVPANTSATSPSAIL